MGFFDSDAQYYGFARLGDTITGVVDHAYVERQATDFATKKPRFYEDGRPVMMAVITLRTENRDGPDDDGLRTIYVEKVSMKNAIARAVRAAGVKDVSEGGTLSVTFASETPSDKGNPIKNFTATYAPPGGMLAQESPTPMSSSQQYVPPTAPPVAQQVSTPAAAPEPGGAIGQVRALSQAGLSPAQISAAVPGFTPEAVQAILNVPA